MGLTLCQALYQVLHTVLLTRVMLTTIRHYSSAITTLVFRWGNWATERLNNWLRLHSKWQRWALSLGSLAQNWGAWPPATAFCYKSRPIFIPPEENIIIKRAVGHTPRTAMLQYSGLLKVVERMLLLSRILCSVLGKLHCPRVEERELCFTHFSPLVTDKGSCQLTNFPRDHTKISLYSVLHSSYTVSHLIAVKLWKNRLYCLSLIIHSLFTPHPGFCPIRSRGADLSEVTENLQSANSTSPPDSSLGLHNPSLGLLVPLCLSSLASIADFPSSALLLSSLLFSFYTSPWPSHHLALSLRDQWFPTHSCSSQSPLCSSQISCRPLYIFRWMALLKMSKILSSAHQLHSFSYFPCFS